VNAPIIAGERGMKVVEMKRARGENFASSIGVRARGASGARYVKGTVFQLGDKPEARVVVIDDYVLDAAPEGRILLVFNDDRPGVIGAIGTLLGKKDINVARLHVGQPRESGKSIMLWNVEADLTPAVLDEVRKLPHIESAQQVKL
jgi:D-3-phosphoglycerate dehydrogenase